MRGAAALLIASAAFASACRATPPAAPSPHVVRYRLVWATDGIEPNVDGPGWAVGNDLGYRVSVTRGWVTSYSMELVECPQEARASLFVETAFAGHLAGTPNPAAIKPMRVESLTTPEESEAGMVTLAPQPYCKLHYLLARAGHDSPGLPAELDMVDTTLHLEGTYRAASAQSETPFTVHTASAYGQLFDRTVAPAAPLHVDTAREGAEVIARRRLRRMFDGVDFATMPEKMMALQILRSLVDHMEVEVRNADH